MGTVVNLEPGFVAGHRGAALLAPENTKPGYETAAAYPWIPIELDVFLSGEGNGALVCMHDSTVDRTTSSSGLITDHNAAQASRLVVDSSVWMGGGWTDTKVPLFADVLRQFGGTCVLVPEAKNTGAAARIVQEVVAQGREQSIILQSFSFTDLTTSWAQAAGIAMMHVIGADADARPVADYVDAGVCFVACGTAVSNTKIQQLRGAGLKVGIWTVNRRNVADAYRADGIDYFISDDPNYIQDDPTRYRLTRAPFAGKGWPDGFQVTAGPGRGTFNGPWWSPETSAQGFVQQGWACPLADPTQYTATFSFRFDALGSDSSRWGAFAFSAPDDRGWTDTSISTDNGYHVIVRASGNLALYKRTNGALTAGPTLATTPFVAGAVSTFTLTVSPSQISVTRSGFSALTWSDTTHRGGYLHLGSNPGAASGMKCAFSNISLT